MAGVASTGGIRPDLVRSGSRLLFWCHRMVRKGRENARKGNWQGPQPRLTRGDFTPERSAPTPPDGACRSPRSCLAPTRLRAYYIFLFTGLFPDRRCGAAFSRAWKDSWPENCLLVDMMLKEVGIRDLHEKLTTVFILDRHSRESGNPEYPGFPGFRLALATLVWPE